LERVGRLAGAGEHGTLEVALRTAIKPMIEVAVDPLEIEEIDQRLPYALVSEDRAAGIEGESRHARRQTDIEFAFYDVTIGHRAGVVAFRPARGVFFWAYIDPARLECFEHGGVVTIIIKTDLIEIEASTIDRKILAPPVWV